MHILIGDEAARVFREIRLRFKEALHFGLCRKTLRGIAFKSLSYNGCMGLITAKRSPATDLGPILVTDRSLERPKASHHAGAHAPDGLLRVLLPEVLSESRMNVLDHHGIRVVFEFHLGADKPAACLAYKIAQIPVAAHIARETVDAVDDDREFGAAIAA